LPFPSRPFCSRCRFFSRFDNPPFDKRCMTNNALPHNSIFLNWSPRVFDTPPFLAFWLWLIPPSSGILGSNPMPVGCCPQRIVRASSPFPLSVHHKRGVFFFGWCGFGLRNPVGLGLGTPLSLNRRAANAISSFTSPSINALQISCPFNKYDQAPPLLPPPPHLPPLCFLVQIAPLHLASSHGELPFKNLHHLLFGPFPGRSFFLQFSSQPHPHLFLPPFKSPPPACAAPSLLIPDAAQSRLLSS